MLLRNMSHNTVISIKVIRLFPNLIIEFRNEHLPHLLGLSKFHHFGLSTYRPVEIFNKLKEDWDLNYLISADESWYAENQDKLVGSLFSISIISCC